MAVKRAIGLDGVPRSARYGRVDTKRWRSLERRGLHLHVFLDGEDVTRTLRIWCADDEAGTVDIYLERNGSCYRDPDNPNQAARETRRGVVEMRDVKHEGPCRLSNARTQ